MSMRRNGVPISHDQCAPYLSTTLLKTEKAPAPKVSMLRQAIVAQIRKGSGTSRAAPVQRKIHKVAPSDFKHGAVDVAWIHYSEIRPPAWYLGNDLKEERHHVVFLAQKSGLVALTFSDSAFRASIITEVRKRRAAPFDGFKVLTAKQINDAFVGDRVRTLWLSGAHRRTATKADSKILTGIELEAALNPLEDQSYYFSSVRSTVDGATLAADAGSSVSLVRILETPESGLAPAKIGARSSGGSRLSSMPRRKRSGRGLSVSYYEIVVGQAVKNLRYLDRSHISEKLVSNKDKQIGSAVWRNGKRQKDRKEILKILSKAGANMSKTVCVFQPSARRSEVEAIGKRITDGDLKRSDVRRLQQLDALLLAARAECLGLGANFQVIGEDDTA